VIAIGRGPKKEAEAEENRRESGKKTKKAKKEEEEDADAIEGDQVQKRTQNQTANSSLSRVHTTRRKKRPTEHRRKEGAAGSNDYSAELFGSDDDNEIIEDSEKVSGDLDEDRSMSEDVTGDDEDGDVTVNTHVKGT